MCAQTYLLSSSPHAFFPKPLPQTMKQKMNNATITRTANVISSTLLHMSVIG